MKATVPATLSLMIVVSSVYADDAQLVDLSKIDRSIAKEPAYQHEPHYALVVFGAAAKHRSWLVLDGNETLYFDRNGNGDLTDPEDRIKRDEAAAKKIRHNDGSGYSGFSDFDIGTVAGVKLQFKLWVRNVGFMPADEWRRKLVRERDENNWEIGTLLRIAADGTGIQNPSVMVPRPIDAQVTHLGGPLTFGLRNGAQQKLQPWPQVTTFEVRIGTPVLPSKNVKHSQFAPLAICELPNGVDPQAVIEFPGQSRDGQPLVQTIKLDQRCCGDTLYAKFAVPRNAGEGIAKVTLTYASPERVVRAATFDVLIGGERKSLDSETSYVMFRDPDQNIGLDEAMVALRVGGFKIQKLSRAELVSLQVQSDDHVTFLITLNRKPEVRDVAMMLGESGPLADVIKQCDARFEILRLPDGNEMNEAELSRIHTILQQESLGIIYTPWDKRLSGLK